MKPRGYWESFGFVAGITAFPFVLLFSFVLSVLFHTSFGTMLFRLGLYAGVGFALIFAFIVAFYIKSETIVIPIQDPRDLLGKIHIALAELGYHPSYTSAQFITFKPSLQAGILGGTVSVNISQNDVTIVGPSAGMKKLQKRIFA